MPAQQDFVPCFKAIEEAPRVSVLTGAGVSTLSGIQDFRGENGFYNQKGPLYGVSREQLFDIDFFRARPEIFYCYARDYLYPMLDKTPSIAHTVLAKMQKAGRIGTVYTQNIDCLHTKARGGRVVELHGTLREHACIDCGRTFETAKARECAEAGNVPRCPECSGLVKPRVVFFGEQLNDNDLSVAFRDAEISDILLVLGSSLTVSPVSSLPAAARVNNRKIVIVNKQPTPFDRDAAFRFDDIALFCGEMEKYFFSE